MSSYCLIRNPRFWQGYCACMWTICCSVVVARPIIKRSMHYVHVFRSANGTEIKENSVAVAFPRICLPKRSVCLRVLNGAVQWLAKESRPDLAVQVSLSQQALSDPRVQHCRQANAMVRRAKHHHELTWRFLSVPLENLRLVMHSDAAFQNAHGGHHLSAFLR